VSEQLTAALDNFVQALAEVTSEEGLYELQVAYLGKKGSVTQLKSEVGKLPPDQRKAFGAAWNSTRDAIEAKLGERREFLKQEARRRDLARRVDLTMPPIAPTMGTLHPLSQTRRRLSETFMRLGFDIAVGPHVEVGAYNFDDLNIASDHPARDMADTFFVAPPAGREGDEIVLRTHTSPVQVRTMRTRTPPIRIVAPGTTFRRDDDATHSPMFHQIEGLYVDRGVTMADLKATLMAFTADFFGQRLDVRFRPSFFPFVEPGAEFDMGCPFCGQRGCNLCKGTGFIELGGCGMVHPAVFEACGVDGERYTGWAFGFGIDRMAMMLHQVTHLRLMFEGDVRFLEQFPC
jgi:phenylalanyl-tRNA synthetase alpha chain